MNIGSAPTIYGSSIKGPSVVGVSATGFGLRPPPFTDTPTTDSHLDCRYARILSVAAQQGAMLSKFRNAGQTCVCTNRILVQDGVYERLVAKLAERVRGLRVGDGSDAQVDIGPLVDKRAIAKVAQLVDRAISQGAKVVEGGERLARPGYFFAPTLLVDVKPEMDICRQEIFGPVATVQRFGTEAEAIALANETDSGLAAYFYGRDMGRVWRVVDALEYGMVGVNEGLISTEVAPFGGIKESGTGREGSRHGIDDYLEFKYVCIGGLESRKIS